MRVAMQGSSLYSRVLWTGVGILILLGLICASRHQTDAPPSNGSRDADLFEAVIARLRTGETYYPAMTEELRARGYAMNSVFNWRLPTLTLLQWAVPSRRVSIGLLTLIWAVAVAAWCWHLWPVVSSRWFVFLPALLATAPTWAWLAVSTVRIHDLWAGQLIALSLALWSAGRTRLSVTAAGGALAIREHALLFWLVMLTFAALERRWRESAHWLVLGAGFFVFVVWHFYRASQFIPPTPLEASWLAFGGWCFALLTTRVNVLMMLTPGWFVALVVPLALAGLFSWRSVAGRRVAATCLGYLIAFTIVGRPDNWYWGLFNAPLLPLGVMGLFSRELRRSSEGIGVRAKRSSLE